MPRISFVSVSEVACVVHALTYHQFPHNYVGSAISNHPPIAPRKCGVLWEPLAHFPWKYKEYKRQLVKNYQCANYEPNTQSQDCNNYCKHDIPLYMQLLFGWQIVKLISAGLFLRSTICFTRCRDLPCNLPIAE